MSRLLAAPITDLLLDRYASDPRLVSLLSQTCKIYRDGFPTTGDMWELNDWLISREGLAHWGSIEGPGGRLLFPHHWRAFRLLEARVVFTGRPREWRIYTQLNRKNRETFENSGLIVLGKHAASMVMVGESRWDVFKDSFQGIRSLPALLDCLCRHAILCHEIPENLLPLPPGVRHRHRDNVPWTRARAFYVWRAARPGYETWNGGRSLETTGSGVMILHTGGSDSVEPRVRMI
jgi:hypothetical protein